MRLLSIRLIASLIVGITLVSLASSYYEALGEKRGLRADLERRAEVLGESLAGNVERDLEKASVQDLQRIVGHFGNREHLLGMAIYGRQGDLLAVTPELASTLPRIPPYCPKHCVRTTEQACFNERAMPRCTSTLYLFTSTTKLSAASRLFMMPAIFGRRAFIFGARRSCERWHMSFSSC